MQYNILQNKQNKESLILISELLQLSARLHNLVSNQPIRSFPLKINKIKRISPNQMLTSNLFDRNGCRKSRLSKKSQTSRKSVNHRQKICNLIQQSSLKHTSVNKPKKSSKTKCVPRNGKQNMIPYLAQIKSSKKKTSKTINSISKTMPIKYSKEKACQFPFQSIKFKDNPSKLGQERKLNLFNQPCSRDPIQYDDSEELDFSFLDNSKKILNSYNQRIYRYENNKAKNKPNNLLQMKDLSFKNQVTRLFNYLDQSQRGIVSQGEIAYKKAPQAALYFLGSIFQKIRENGLQVSQKDFHQECNKIYFRSSSQDIKWFLCQMQSMNTAIDDPKLDQKPQLYQRPKLDKQPKPDQTCKQGTNLQKESLKQITNVFHSNYQNKPSQQFETETNIQLNEPQKTNKNHNQSLRQQSSIISFRKQNVYCKARQMQSRNSFTSQVTSLDSAKFGVQTVENRIVANQKKSKKQLSTKMEIYNSDYSGLICQDLNQKNSLINQRPHDSTNFSNPNYRIKRNMINKQEDVRDQIYAKLDRIKMTHQIEHKNPLNNRVTTFQKQRLDQHKMTNISLKVQREVQKPIQIASNCQKTVSKIKFAQQQRKLQATQFDRAMKNNKQISLVKQDRNQKQSSWISKSRKCQNSFTDLQKLREQFKTHKDVIEQRQKQRQNYFRNQLKSIPTKESQDDYRVQNQSRIVKFIQNKNSKQNKTYEKNIDLLSTFSVSRKQNIPSLNFNLNLNSSLTSSCRRSVEISLPLKYDAKNRLSMSQSKGQQEQTKQSKLDKIDELSQKIQQYLKTNAQKIQYSKNFTQGTGRFSNVLYS